jgi:hypothetical protein
MNTEAKKYQKPEGFKGRGEGNTNWKKYKWSIIMFDKETNEFRTGKFVSLDELNKEMGLTLSLDTSWRLRTLKRVDVNKRNKENSFLGRYGHIKLEKINEWKEGVYANTRASEKSLLNKK